MRGSSGLCTTERWTTLITRRALLARRAPARSSPWPHASGSPRRPPRSPRRAAPAPGPQGASTPRRTRAPRGYDGVYWRLVDRALEQRFWATSADAVVTRWREAMGTGAPDPPQAAELEGR